MPNDQDPSPRLDMGPTVERFASLGVNCELGLVQRWCGVEPLGLFRFGLTPFEGLVAALESRFAGLSDPSEIEIGLGYLQEYLVRHRRYGFEFHTRMHADRAPEADVWQQVVGKRFPLLSRMLTEDLETASKLFVFRPEDAGGEDEAYRLLGAMRRYGSPSLLWVTLTEEPEEIGSVRWLADGLMVGYLDRFGPLRYARGLSFEAWLSVCRNAHDLWAGGRAVGRAA